MLLSKSDYVHFLKHPAWLWLRKHQKSSLPEPDAALQALFDAGNEFEKYAEQLFPTGERLEWQSFEEYEALTQRTTDQLAAGADCLFQARFVHDGLNCIVDVLKRVEGNTFDLFEIKSSTSSKPEHIPDLAFQVLVLEASGLEVRNIGIIHVNNQYTRHGDVDVEGLTAITDVTEEVRDRLDRSRSEIEEARSVIESDNQPDLSPRYAARSAMRDWLDVYRIIETDRDTSSYPIYELAGVRPDQIAFLEDNGIKSLLDVPEDFKLTASQRRQIDAIRFGKARLDKPAILRFLDGLTFPLFFLDYETVGDVIPPFDGVRPYQQIPFQYSLHVLDKKGGRLQHREFLHDQPSMPAGQLLQQLERNIGTTGSVVVWYAPFERGRNNDLAELEPGAAPFLESINRRMVDLRDPFTKGDYTDPKFAGSTSIKNVLPALVPDLDYKGLAIGNGADAQLAWKRLILDQKDTGQRETILDDLKQYCALDTLAMVRIYEVLSASSKPSLLERVLGH